MENLMTTQKNIKKTLKGNKPPYFKYGDIVIYNDDILKISSIPESSVDLIVTSPPYNVDIHYNSHIDNLNYEDYLDFTKNWLKKCLDLTKDDGRFCLNIPLDKIRRVHFYHRAISIQSNYWIYGIYSK